MKLSKIQEKNLNNVICKFINYGLNSKDDIYFLLMGYKCFMYESDELINYCLDYVSNIVGNEETEDIYYGL